MTFKLKSNHRCFPCICNSTEVTDGCPSLPRVPLYNNSVCAFFIKKRVSCLISHGLKMCCRKSKWIMVTSSNGNIFRVTGHWRWEFTGHRWIPHTKASDAKILCFLWSAPEWTVEQTIMRLVTWDVIMPIMTSQECDPRKLNHHLSVDAVVIRLISWYMRWRSEWREVVFCGASMGGILHLGWGY